MSVNLVSTPDRYALTKGGRMLYEFTGSGRTISTGSFAVNAINFPGLPVPDGTRFVLRWDGHSEEIVARTVPADVNEIPAGNGGEAYVQSLLPYFEAFFLIREDFAVTIDGIGGAFSLIFEANKSGPRYNFAATNAKAPGSITPVANVDPRFKGGNALLRERYSIYVELHLQRTGTAGSTRADFDRIYQTNLETNEQGTCRFNAGDLLNAHLKADWPDWNNALPTVAVHSHRKYYIAYAEAWGSPLRIGRIATNEIRHAYLGGSDYLSRGTNGLALTALTGTPNPAADRSLRSGPLTRYVRPDEPQYLTFANLRTEAITALRLSLTLTLDNGTTVNVASAYPDKPAADGDKVTFPVGTVALGLAALIPPGRSLREYTAQLRVGGVAYSTVYRYLINYDYQPHTRYFAYLSSLGCVDTLTTFGKGSYELTRFYEQAERVMPANYELKDGQFVDYDVAVQQQVDVATGFRGEAELRIWTDFYCSPQRFSLQTTQSAGMVALPIGIVSKSIKQAKDGDTLFAHKFEYAYLFRDDFYTDRTIEAGDGQPPPGFVPGGTVAVSLPTLVAAFDNTIPAFIRELTQGDVNRFKVAAARPNPETLGYLNQNAASLLFRRQDQPVPWLSGVSDKPTTRNGFGLADVLTGSETLSLAMQTISRNVRIRTKLASWTTPNEPIHIR